VPISDGIRVPQIAGSESVLVTSESLDPVPTDRFAILGGGRAFEHTPASLDDSCRSNVLLVTNDQKSIDTFAMSYLD
jgi:hypothetical protein